MLEKPAVPVFGTPLRLDPDNILNELPSELGQERMDVEQDDVPFAGVGAS